MHIGLRGTSSELKLPLVKPPFWKIKWTGLLLLPLAVAATLMIATVWYAEKPSYTYSNPLWGCDAGGKLYLAPAYPSIWSLETALYPTIPLFTSRLPTIRSIDILWDLIVGRGYRGACTILVYQVFRTVMSDIMRTERLPHDQVLAMEYSTVSIPSIVAYIKSSVRAFRTFWTGSKASVWTTTILILASAYTFAAPTWLSAMTSYQGVMRPFLSTEDGLVSFDQLMCTFVIVDGQRIGLHSNFCIQDENALVYDTRVYLDAGNACYPGSKPYYWKPQPEECGQPSMFHFSNGTSINLSSPALTILSTGLVYHDHTLSRDHLTNYGQCQPQQDLYEWGFSFIILFSFMIATAIVASCVSFLWYRYTDRIWPQQVDMMFGKLRTALVVAASVQDKIGEGMYEMTEEELKASLMCSDGIGHAHARSSIMFSPGPAEESKPKSGYRLPVSSDRCYTHPGRVMRSTDEKEKTIENICS